MLVHHRTASFESSSTLETNSKGFLRYEFLRVKTDDRSFRSWKIHSPPPKKIIVGL